MKRLLSRLLVLPDQPGAGWLWVSVASGLALLGVLTMALFT